MHFNQCKRYLQRRYYTKRSFSKQKLNWSTCKQRERSKILKFSLCLQRRLACPKCSLISCNENRWFMYQRKKEQNRYLSGTCCAYAWTKEKVVISPVTDKERRFISMQHCNTDTDHFTCGSHFRCDMHSDLLLYEHSNNECEL